MNPQKFKEWLLKIDNAHIEKPAQNARLNKLSAQIQQLSVQVHHLLRQKDCAMTSVEDGLNNKTSQLLVIQSKSRQRLNAARNKIQKQKEIKEGQFKTQVKLITQLCDNFSHKGRQFVEQIRKKNLYHLQILASELQNLRQLRSKFCQSKQAKNRSYQIWMEKSIRRADIIIESQEKDLMLIEEYEKELMSRCDAVQKQFELKLEAKTNQSQRKQKLLFQKLELLISNIDVE